jgi:hypothetical protein
MLTRNRRPTVPATGGTYTGAWRNAHLYSDRALPPGPGVDPSHMRPDAPDPGQVVAGYPRVDHPPMYLTTTPDDAYAFELDTPGVILSTEPITHDAGDPDVHHSSPIPGAEWTSRPPSLAAHALDRGAQLEQLYAPFTSRAHDERPETVRWEDSSDQKPSTVAALRGANSLKENNPEGFPTGTGENGHLVKRFYHRFMPHERFVHTERALYPAGAASAVVSPAMTPANSNRYTSPFAWRSFYGTRNWQTPLMRRNPPEAWNDQTADGTDSTSDVPADWVID